MLLILILNLYKYNCFCIGLCFSVRVGVPPPPSLVNMYKELDESISGFVKPDHGYLIGWAKQGMCIGNHLVVLFVCPILITGVLLLNACLTVRAREPNSHAGKVNNLR